MRPDRSKQILVLLVSMLAVGLLAFAVISFLRWQDGGPKENDGLVIRPIPIDQAPAFVREAAMRLAPSRVGYVMPQADMAYVIISAGQSGERLELAGARRAGTIIDIDVRTSSTGQPVLIGLLQTPVMDTRLVQFHLDGYAAGIPALVNRDSLPLMALPDKASLALVAPVEAERIMGNTVQISGYARIFEAQFSVTVFAAGKGRVLGEVQHVMAATGAPNWGSFRVNVPVTVPVGVLDGIVLVHDEQSGAKLAVPIKFGAK